jgi:DNA-binding MarR family transcriptional regulator
MCQPFSVDVSTFFCDDGLMTKTRWLSETENQVWKNFTLMQFQLFALLGRELTDTGLSFQEYIVLAELSERPNFQARLTDLGRQLGWEKSRISHQVTRMEQRELVAKVKCPNDQRSYLITLTKQGHAAIKAAAPHHVTTVRQYFIDTITPEQLRVLGQLTTEVLHNLPEP